MPTCDRVRSTLAMLILLGGTGLASAGLQFVDETSARFPDPNPSEWTNQLTVGDLDGDGDLDLVFANGGGFSSPGSPEKARIYINSDTQPGFFTDETDARTGGHAGLHRGVELGDCDNDGDLDMVLAQDFNQLPNLLVNDGGGFFTVEGGTRLPAITLSSSRAQFGDVDNDGDLDLFFTSGTTSRFTCGQYRLYLNDGNCTYTDATSTHFPLGNVCNNMDCIFGDIDNDFDIDIRTASTGTNNSRLYRNDGTGVFTVVSGVPNDGSTYSYDFGDIDGDGDLDLLGANGSPTSNAEILLENDGTGAYSDVSSQISPNPNQDDNDSKFLDYDNDGDLDLIIARLGSGGEKLYRNDGTGVFGQTSGVFQVVSDSSLDIMVADLTGNGRLDVVTGQGESGAFQNRVYINYGPADTIPPTIVATEQAPNADGPQVIRALILDQMSSDRNFFDKGVELNYSLDAGPPQSVPMRHSGGQVYRGVIPDQISGSTVEYWITATDFNDNTGTGATRSYLIPDCSALDDCSGHGTCVANDDCDCDFGWSGVDCSESDPFPAGEVPTGQFPNRPLKINKAGAGQILLTWDSSCNAGDIDFEVYEGAIGNFTSHVPLFCSTDGLRLKTLTPGAGNVYYLVVPTSITREGSYGSDSADGARPASARACLEQTFEACE